jgi:hypothetical protein
LSLRLATRTKCLNPDISHESRLVSAQEMCGSEGFVNFDLRKPKKVG